MKLSKSLINVEKIEKIEKMLFEEEKYVMEFAKASIESFSDFSDHYSRSLTDRNLENLCRAGHKIKPVAQLLDLDMMLVEFDKAKQELESNSLQTDLQESAERIRELCTRVTLEFQMIIDQIKNRNGYS